MSTATENVWLITGTSSGFGRELTLQVLARGDKVIATARDTSKLSDLVSKGAHALTLDVTSPPEQIQKVIGEAIAVYGRIDILVNNAGYLIEGAVEETSHEETLRMWTTNVFGMLNVTNALLPHLRSRRTGTIANLGSIGGYAGMAGAGPYCVTKWAVAGYSESLHAELTPLGITVICIEPGYFRTDFLKPGNRQFTKNRIADYDATAGAVRDILNQVDRNQPGDPVKGVKVMIDIITKTGVAEGRELPVRITLGSDSFEWVRRQAETNLKLLEDWGDVIKSTDHDDVKAQGPGAH
ncbi:hypothetical protein HK097_000810 [Rhizophlyctis rosea]|uniref:Ketoreductase domain-containing protein n=1 Tax=Rhizophlyctis rosea TaxID=64517 RepID=A0AAD5S559_9FUNG|nr:hypothetical protein HK097_000810 [Rhizophlyctis rosea]